MKGRSNSAIHILLIIVFSLILIPLTAGYQEGKLSPELAAELQGLSSWEKARILVFMKKQPDLYGIETFNQSPTERRQRVILTLQAAASSTQEPLLSELACRPEVEIEHTYWIINGLVLQAPKSVILEIAARPDVDAVVKDGVMRLPPAACKKLIPFDKKIKLAWGVKKIQALRVWNKFGYYGEGITIAVIDTGVNEHSDLKGRIVDGKNYIEPGKPPRDNHGHGTHISGTIAGDGQEGIRTGVAPIATIWAIKVLDENGEGSWTNLFSAIEEAIAANAGVINLSMGGSPDKKTRKRLRNACKNAIAAGVIPVIAAARDENGGIHSPGDVPEVITVGALNRKDEITDDSGQGPVKWGKKLYIKPDLAAPGEDIISCSYDSGDYHKLDGPSFSCPHVVGVAALMLNANPNLDTVKVKQIMEITAKNLGKKGKDNKYGSGLLRAVRAVIKAHQY